MLNIDTTSGEVIDRDFDLIPSGWYMAQIVEHDLQNVGNGLQARFTWEILDGPHSRRKVWQKEWAHHSNPKASEIGERMLRTLGRAMGVSQVKSTEDLAFKPVEVRVGISKKEEGYEQRNEVKSARPLGVRSAAGGSAPAASGAAKTPWGAR
ncbi:MAG: DUF669 domain-containing protein [Phycisphaerales bacterium]|jgi:hypothetical protein